MKKIYILIIGLVFLVTILILLRYFRIKENNIEIPDNKDSSVENKTELLTTDNLIDCINLKGGILYTELQYCRECVQQDKLFTQASPPIGPTTKWETLQKQETGSPCRGMPCWTWDSRRFFGCRNIFQLNEDYDCGLEPVLGYRYKYCHEIRVT